MFSTKPLFVLIVCTIFIISTGHTYGAGFGAGTGFGAGSGGGGGPGSRGMTPYDRSTFTTIQGTVADVTTVLNPVMKEEGMHLELKTASDTVLVHVVPKWYADKNKKKFDFFKGEKISVSGSQFSKNQQPNIYAATIKRQSGLTLKLRNIKSGQGLWSGRYRPAHAPKNLPPHLQKKREEFQKMMREKMIQRQQNMGNY